jgi:integrase
MRWQDVKDLDGPLATISLTQQKTGSAVTIPIAEPLRAALKAIPKAERTGYLLGDVAAAYVEGRRRRFIRAWRDLLDAVPLAEMVDVPTIAKIERKGEHGRTRYAWSYHSFRHTTATYLSGPDAHYLLGHRSAAEKSLGVTAQYRHEDLQRLKRHLDEIPIAPPANVVKLQRKSAARKSPSRPSSAVPSNVVKFARAARG